MTRPPRCTMPLSFPRRIPGAGSDAFTIIEVLVSAAILGIVMIVLLGTLTSSLSLWRNTESKIVSDREARASQLLLMQDLSSVVVPSNTNFWPRIVRVGSQRNSTNILKFLTLKPSEYQGSNAVGDVCYVEYSVMPGTNNIAGYELRRLFLGSADTFDEVFKAGKFPDNTAKGTPQSLGLYLLASNVMAARGLTLASEANNTNFVILNTNLLPLTGSYNALNRPAAIEVNFAVADPDTLANSNVIANPEVVLRNAGLYSSRFFLPPPAP